MTGRRAKARARGGFTLIEVLIAFGVLTVGLLSVAVMQVRALQEGSRGHHTSQAAVVARDQMEQIHRLPWTSVAPTGGLFVAPPWINFAGQAAGDVPITITSAGAGDLVEQVYRVRWRVADDLLDTNLRNVDLQVSWTESGGFNRTLTLSSLKYNGG